MTSRFSSKSLWIAAWVSLSHCALRLSRWVWWASFMAAIWSFNFLTSSLFFEFYIPIYYWRWLICWLIVVSNKFRVVDSHSYCSLAMFSLCTFSWVRMSCSSLSFFRYSSSKLLFNSLYPRLSSESLCSNCFRLLIARSYSYSSFFRDYTCEINAEFWFFRSSNSITCFPSKIFNASVTAFSIWTPTPWRISSFSCESCC